MRLPLATPPLADAALAAYRLDKAALKLLISGVIKPDLDTDGDGTKAAMSAAWSFTAVPGQIVGLAP